MKESLLYDRLNDSAVQCHVCLRRCVIPVGQRGFCRTRLNREGRLYSLTYGRVAVRHVAPIEIKPLFHFHPGSRALSLGSVGCNFKCPGCQNWDIAHREPGEGEEETTYIAPEDAVLEAKEFGCQGISWTYNEPTLWYEYTLEGAKLAKRAGMYTNYVTNGSMTPEALDRIGPHLDAFRVDVKGFSVETYQRIAHLTDVDALFGTIERAKKKWGMWVEVVTNVIPGYNDGEDELADIASWIARRLGRETPWHITRFVPHFQLSSLQPTSLQTMERARAIGHRQGLRFVYLGNVPGHPAEHTYCDRCGHLLIERRQYSILSCHLMEDTCSNCGTTVPLIGRVSCE